MPTSIHRPRIPQAMLFMSMAPITLLAGYFFVFRWLNRIVITTGDYCAVVTCALLGMVLLLTASRPSTGMVRMLAAGGHALLTGLVFLTWRWLSQPVLNDIF